MMTALPLTLEGIVSCCLSPRAGARRSWWCWLGQVCEGGRHTDPARLSRSAVGGAVVDVPAGIPTDLSPLDEEVKTLGGMCQGTTTLEAGREALSSRARGGLISTL